MNSYLDNTGGLIYTTNTKGTTATNDYTWYNTFVNKIYTSADPGVWITKEEYEEFCKFKKIKSIKKKLEMIK